MAAATTVTRRTYGLVVVATVTYTLLTFSWFTLPAYLSTIVPELGLTDTQAGIVVGAVPLTYVPLGLLTGVAVDRIGPGRSLAAGSVCVGLAQVGRSWVSGFPDLLGLTLLLGVGATTITFGLPKLVSTLFPAEKTGVPSSIYLIGAAGGTAAAFGLGRPTIGPLLGGWRPLFFWSGLAAVGYGVVWYAVGRSVGVDRRVATENEAFSLSALAADLRRILSDRALQYIVLVGTMYLLVMHGLQGWLPTVLESRGSSATLAGQATGLFVVATALGIFAVPWLADRVSTRQLALVGCGAAITVGLLGIVGTTGALVTAGIVVAGVGAGGLSPLIRAIPPAMEGIGVRHTGTAIGFVFAVGELGGFLGPVLVGGLRDATGSFAPGLGLLAASGVVVMAAGVRLRGAF